MANENVENSKPKLNLASPKDRRAAKASETKIKSVQKEPVGKFQKCHELL